MKGENMLSANMLEFLLRMPKLDLHVHIEGTIDLPTLIEIADKNDYLSELSRHQRDILSGGNFVYKDFSSFIDTYTLCANALRTADDYERVVYEYLLRSSRLNVRYVEAYVSPYGRMKRGVAFDQIMSGIVAGKRRAEKETGILSGIVIDVGRHLLWSTDMDPDTARKECLGLVEIAANYKRLNGEIVGFSLGGKEIGYPVFPFVEAFDLARANGLHVKAHTGESTDTSDMWYVAGLLKAERMVNSVRAINDKGLLRFLRENEIAVELCPTGNVLTGAVDSFDRHPFRRFLEEGVSLSIGDDDPALFGTDIHREYKILAEQFGLTAADLEKMVFDMLDIAWLDRERRRSLRASMAAEFLNIREGLNL